MHGRIALVACVALWACSGKDDAPDPGAKTEDAPAKQVQGDAKEAPPSPVADDTGAPAPASSGEAPEPAPGDDPFRGPCKVQWSDGRTLTFKYTDEGGSVSVDENGDGTRDNCGTFKSKEGRITYLRIDEGCDRDTDATVRVKYQGEGAVVASVTMTRGDETRRMTMIPLPSFGSILPGYVLPGRERDLSVESEGERIQSVTVKKGAGRPAKKVSFSYDAEGHVSGVVEDVEIDGKAELQFTYGYDAAGNVNAIRSTVDGREATAELSYACWS